MRHGVEKVGDKASTVSDSIGGDFGCGDTKNIIMLAAADALIRFKCTHLWPMAKVIPLLANSDIAPITPSISGAAVIILTPETWLLQDILQSSASARLSAP